MTIKKFQGRTQDEAIAKAKAELGENAVIMNVKEGGSYGGKGKACGLRRCAEEFTENA